MKSRHNSNEPATELSDQALLGVFGGADAHADPSATPMASVSALNGAPALAHVPGHAAHDPGPVAHPVSAVPGVSGAINALHSAASAIQGTHSHVSAPHVISSVPAVSHAPVISHGPAIAHAPVISHGPAISHAPVVSHGPAIAHAAPIAHATPISHSPAISHSNVAHTIQHAINATPSVPALHAASQAISHGLPVHVVIAHAEAPNPGPNPNPNPNPNPPKPDPNDNDHPDFCDHMHEIHERFEHAAKDFHDGLDHFIDGAADMAHAMVDLLPGGHTGGGGAAGINILRGVRRHGH